MAKSEVTSGEMRDFLLVLRQALLIIVKYVERRYMSPASSTPAATAPGAVRMVNRMPMIEPPVVFDLNTPQPSQPNHH